MTIRVNAFGKTIAFPAGTSPEDIEKHISSNRALLDPEYKAPETGILGKAAQFGKEFAQNSLGVDMGIDASAQPTGQDYLKGFASGANKLVSGIGYLAEVAGAKDTGKSIREFGDRGAAYWNNLMSEGGKKAASDQVFEDDEDSITGLRLSDNWGKALLMGASQSAPSMFAAAVPGALTTSAIQKLASLGLAGGSGATIPLLAGTAAPVGVASNIIARTPAAIGFGSAEGITAGAMNAADLKSSIEGMPIEELRKSPVFAVLESEHGEDAARSLIAEQAASDVFGRTAVSTGAIGALTGGGALGQAYQKATGAAKGGILNQTIKGSAQEALQEAPQSGMEKLIENVAVRDYLNPDQNIMDGVLADAASGAAIGGLMGGVVGGAGAVNVSASRAAKINEERTKLGLNKIASSGSVDEAINAAAETVSQKPVTPKDIWDDQAARDDLLMRAEQINQQEGVQNEAQVQGTETPAAKTDVLGTKPAETLLNQDVVNDELNPISSPAQLDKDASDSDIIAQNLGNAAKGAATEIILPDNTTLPAEWMVVDADNVKATMKNGINQPRDRTRAAADVQIQQIANQPDYRRMSDSPVMDIGAPTLDSSGAIVGGNGRFEGVSRGYEAGTSAAYRAALEADAVKKGINPATFAGMKKPVLVRRVTQPFDTQKLAVASNSGGSLEYSALERAKIDAERIGDIDQIEVTDSGDIALTKDNAANIRNALKGYSASELGSFVDNEGNLSQEGSRRLKNAILYSAYGNSKTLSRMVESTDTDMRNIVGALTKTAGQAAKVRSNIKSGGLPKSLDITDNLIEAVEKIGQIRSSGDTVENYLTQGELFSDIALSDTTKEIMTGLSGVMRSQKRMVEFLRATYSLIEKVDVTTDNVFGEPDIPSKLEVVKHAKQQTAEQRPASLFGEEAGTESAAKINNITSAEAGAKYSRSPEERLKDRERSRKLERALQREGYDFRIQARDVRLGITPDGKGQEAIAAEQIARIFRKRITRIEADGDFKINGVMVPSIPDTIFIDVNTNKAAHIVMGHELSHHMEQDVPEVYQAMVDALMPMIRDVDAYSASRNLGDMKQENVIKEIVGDIVGDNFAKPEFWNKVAAYNPNAFRKIADTIISWIKRLVTNAKARGLGSEQWVTDAQKAQDIVAKAVSQYTYTESSFDGLKNKPVFQKAWHGSPHDHDKFDASKIGTGEGAQAYGWGLYFAENRNVAEWYKKKLSKKYKDVNVKDAIADGVISNEDILLLRDKLGEEFKRKIVSIVANKDGYGFYHAYYVYDNGVKEEINMFPYDDADYASIEEFVSDIDDSRVGQYFFDDDVVFHQALRNGIFVPKSSSKLYQVELTPKPDEYLLWDKPLSEQSEKVKAALKRGYSEMAMDYPDKSATPKTGREIYDDFVVGMGGLETMDKKAASDYLHELGVRGIKYLDGTSRGTGEGSYNYVIFDDKDVEITAKFSREQSEKNLYVAHNLTAENIRHANEIGGLAAPSLAVAKTGKGFSGFGEITLIAKPDLLKTSKVRTFDSDVYTPRHPRAVHKINQSKYDRFVESLGDVQGLGIPNIEELSSDSGIEAITRSPGVQYHWLSTQDKQPAVKPKAIDPDTRKVVKLMNQHGLVREWQAEQNEKVMSAVNSYIDRKIEEFRGRIKDRLGDAEEGNLRRNYKHNILLSASRYIESGGKDLSSLKSEVTEKISRNKKLENEFKVYVLGKFNNLVDEKRIFKGFTPAGKRKYIPYDMDNIIKEMTRTLRAGEDFFYGAGNIRAAFAKEFRNISEIQADRDRIVSPDEMEKIKDDAQNKVANAIEELKPYYRYEKDSINYYSDAAQAIAEGRKGQNEAFNLDNDARKIIDDLTNYLRHLPTEYFEAKAQRPVSFSEFKSAVVPKGTPKDVIDILKQSGLSVTYYTRGDEQSRSEAVKKSAEKKKALFSRAESIPDTITIDGKERPTRNSEGRLIHPTEKGIRNFWDWFGDSKVVDDQGRPLVVYHGTSADFSVFETGKLSSTRGSDKFDLFYFTTSKSAASLYAENSAKRDGGDNVIPAYLKLENPLIVTNQDDVRDDGDGFIRYYDDSKDIAEIAVKSKNQIKSAIGNTGQFSPDSDDIRFSRSNALSQAGVNTEEAAKPSSLPEETKTQAFRRRAQDTMLRFKVVQNWLKEQGVNLSEAANVYQRENISKGKTANKIEDFRREQLEPLIKSIAETSKKATGEGKFDLADIATYLEAVHIPEANERMRTIHKDDKATANGITDDQARKVVQQFESMPNFAEFKKLADDVRKIGIDTLDMRLDAGLISQDQYDAYKSTYKNWVPLRGNMSKQGFGKGMSTNAKDKRRMGHGFREEEFVIENLVQDRERAIMQIEKNKIGMTVAQFLMEAENPNIGTIDKPEKMRVMKDFSYAVTFKGRTVGSFETEAGARNAINKIMERKGDLLPEGESFTQTDFNIEKSYDPHIVMMARPQLAENEIQVYVNGHAVRLQLNDTGLARAATNAGIEQVGAIAHGARMFNRFLSKAYTAWSPDFLFMNMARDAYSGTLVLTGKKGAAFAAKTFTNYGTAIRELIKGRNDPKKSEWVSRYRAAGGNIGAAYLSDLERVGEDAVAALQEFAGARETYRMVYNEQISKGSSPAKARTMAALKAGVAKTKAAPVVGHLFKTLERVNMVIENALRLATFKTAIESGESDQQAAMLSKDLMNFNRKGEMANQMGALYLFYNPGMQGAHIVGEALFTSKHRKQVWALLGALTTLSFILAEFARGGEDDDDREWENTPDYIKDRNLIFQFGDKQITVPVAYGFGIFHAMGNYLSDLNHGADKSEIAVKLASGMFENFSVFGNPVVGDDDNIETRLSQLSPTLMKLMFGPEMNMDGLGRQIQPDKASWDQSVPYSQNMFRSVRGTVYEDIAHFMNDITGGNKYNPGAIDISPNTIKYWVTSLTGGAGRFVSDITTGSLNAAEGVSPEIENVPVLRKFIRQPGVSDSRSAFHKARKEAQNASDRFDKALKNGDVFISQQMLDENHEIIALANYAKQARKMAAEARDAIMQIQLDKDMSKAEKKVRIKEIELQEQRVYDQFLSAFDVAKGMVKK